MKLLHNNNEVQYKQVFIIFYYFILIFINKFNVFYNVIKFINIFKRT